MQFLSELPFYIRGGNLLVEIYLSQAVPGCILISDIIGQSGRPIMLKNTVLTDQYISILEKFLVTKIDVSKQLANGETFTPLTVDKSDECVTNEKLSFADHYMHVVKSFKQLFHRWEIQQPLDMIVLRRLVIPLLKRLDKIGSKIYSLYKYVTKEEYFYHHSIAVGLLATYTSQIMGYKKGESLQIGLAGILSDCGMSKIPGHIRSKAGKLHEQEMVEVKRHPIYSYRMVEHAKTITQAVKVGVLQHHERMDGSGYPLGVSGENIHPYARIIAVCDVYHAMTCDRIHQESTPLFTVVDELREEQFSKLDPKVALTFVKQLSHYSIGTIVRLSNDQIGEIVFIHDDEPTRPMIKLKENDKIISLQQDSTLYIKDVL